MKRVSILMITIALTVTNMVIPTCAKESIGVISEPMFEDVFEGDYYYAPTMWALENQITSGITQTLFAPAATCTRGQVVTFLWRANGKPEPSTMDNPFSDVNENDYFYKAVLWAVQEGITGGLSAEFFSPYQYCTRAQTLTFLWRTKGMPDTYSESTWSNQYSATYYGNALKWAESCGLIWEPMTAFNPNDNCPRADIVSYMYYSMVPNGFPDSKEPQTWSSHVNRFLYLEMVAAYEVSYGTESSALQITSAEDISALAAFTNSTTVRNFSDRYISLTQDINLDNYQWEPICKPSVIKDSPNSSIEYYGNGGFEGTFMGNGHSIRNLYFSNWNSCIVGLFGAINRGTVADISISGIITGYWNLGSIAGYNMCGTIRGCNSSMTLKGNGICIGGIVGQNSGNIIDCRFSGEVRGHDTQSGNIGGLAGWSGAGLINNSECTGKVSGGYRVGGLVGRLQNRGVVKNSIFSGIVRGNKYVGPFVGINDGAYTTVADCTTH